MISDTHKRMQFKYFSKHNRNKRNLQSIYLLYSERCQRIYPSNLFHSWHPLVSVCVIYYTSKYSTLFPWAITRTIMRISDRINRRKKKSQTHTHKQNSIKKQTGSWLALIVLNCCETAFQNSPLVIQMTYCFFF